MKWHTVLHPFQAIGALLDRTVFRLKTEEEKIAELYDHARGQAEQAARVIRDHMFTEHMARAKIRALEDWNHQRDLLCTVKSVTGPQEGKEGSP